mmetsp:Transcript_153800/g.493173  ORF Transcript_153800/g.493173 Transcript_153800/m.493173 type:complete len:668 (-) Transcript_153800:577-2580(-)
MGLAVAVPQPWAVPASEDVLPPRWIGKDVAPEPPAVPAAEVEVPPRPWEDEDVAHEASANVSHGDAPLSEARVDNEYCFEFVGDDNDADGDGDGGTRPSTSDDAGLGFGHCGVLALAEGLDLEMPPWDPEGSLADGGWDNLGPSSACTTKTSRSSARSRTRLVTKLATYAKEAAGYKAEFVRPERSTRTLSEIPTLGEEGLRTKLHIMLGLSLGGGVEHLRATHASAPLRRFGAVLRSGAEASTDFGLSFPTDSIEHFWTHSWRGSGICKTLVLLAQYNLVAAASFSVLAAALGAGLTALDVLPHGPKSSLWSMVFGTATFLVVAVFWRSKKRVFLDKVCIEQSDLEKKQQGVDSIGTYLYHSQKMLVLWDPSYASRLWCIFEMAAFAWAHGEDVAGRIIVRPLVFGAVLPWLFLTSVVSWSLLGVLTSVAEAHTLHTFQRFCIIIATAASMPCVHILRRCGQELQTMMQHLNEFSVTRADCHCCSVGHVDLETGETIPCDRAVIEACIVAWFGSVEEFEAHVHKDLARNFQQSLGRFGMPYSWLVLAKVPVVWSYMDFIAVNLSGGEWTAAGELSLIGLANWLGAIPLSIALMVRISGMFHRRENRLLDAASTFASGILSLLVTDLIWGSLQLIRAFTMAHDIQLAGACVYCCTVGVLTCIVYRKC